MPAPPAVSNGGGYGGEGGGGGGGSLVDIRLAGVLAIDRTLDATAAAFAEAFAPHERFRANCQLCVMLQVSKHATHASSAGARDEELPLFFVENPTTTRFWEKITATLRARARSSATRAAP